MSLLSRRLLAAALLSAFATLASRAVENPAPEPAVPALSLDAALGKFFPPPVTAASSPASDAGDAIGEFNSARPLRDAQAQLAQLRPHLETNDYANALRQARHHARQAATSEVRQRWTDLIAALEAKQSKTDAVLIDALEAMIARHTKQILSARTVEELDTLLDKIREILNTPGSGGARAQRLQNRLQTQAQLIPSWQRMLLARQAGDLAAARAILRDLARHAAHDASPSRDEIRAYARIHELVTLEFAEAVAQLDARIKLAVDSALAAQKAAELQPHLAALVALRDTCRADPTRPSPRSTSARRTPRRSSSIGRIFSPPTSAATFATSRRPSPRSSPKPTASAPSLASNSSPAPTNFATPSTRTNPRPSTKSPGPPFPPSAPSFSNRPSSSTTSAVPTSSPSPPNSDASSPPAPPLIAAKSRSASKPSTAKATPAKPPISRPQPSSPSAKPGGSRPPPRSPASPRRPRAKATNRPPPTRAATSTPRSRPPTGPPPTPSPCSTTRSPDPACAPPPNASDSSAPTPPKPSPLF